LVKFRVRWIKKRYKKRREYRYKHYDLGLPTKLNDEIEPHEKKDFELDFTSRETAEKEIINITMQELNQKLSIINRVVIHPKYRTIGLGAKLIMETLPFVGTPYVEMVAVMAKYNPFAEKAGMRRIAVQQPTEGVLRISELLSDFGFDLQLLGSNRYVFSKIEELNPAQIGKLKELFIKNKHPRFKKEFAVSRHQPFGKTSDYVACLENADLTKMAKLIKLVGMLLQTKVYLFWRKP